MFIYLFCTVIGSQDITIHSHHWNYALFKKNNDQTTEMEQQILKAINHIKYVSKKGVTVSGIKRFLKKSTTTFDETSVVEIICEIRQNGKIDDKFKTINPIYDDKNLRKTPSKFIWKVATINLIFQKNQ